ncbi:universal stress protein [Natronolimnobius baerhuensis]|uniref:Universal stress protein UspA n=1 Tax=Natronolimnobius baerhuensis TaxID=253108 RepID=A0A202E474_9EURY|nr:universal stress protein [Natronolimnobius baerhuensis]OVE83052.1 universal stress protein UspA [Natronolimnobius baerhuensis]
MSEQILVPFDGSPQARAALEYSFETFPEATVTALYVVPVPEGYWAAFGDGETITPVIAEATQNGEAILEDAATVAATHDRDLETDHVTGEPHNEIIAYADDGGYDTIVMGSHGRDGISRILLGSVAEAVVRRSPVPVVVVR